jgi:hypothetical protein
MIGIETIDMNLSTIYISDLYFETKVVPYQIEYIHFVLE